MTNAYQQEADQLLKELESDLNDLLPEGTRCMKLLYQEYDGTNTWKGRFQGYSQGKAGIYQFALNLKDETISIGEEVAE